VNKVQLKDSSSVKLSQGINPAARRAALKKDVLFRFLVIFSAILVSVIIIFIVIFISQQGLQTFREADPLEFFFKADWDPPKSYGAFNFIVGSFAVAFLALSFSVPLGLASAVFMTKIAPKMLGSIMRTSMNIFIGIPSVVYGWVGLMLFRPVIQQLSGQSGYGLLLTGLILGIMVLPTIAGIAGDSIAALSPKLERSAYALGATRWQTICFVLLPAAAPGLVASVAAGFARAIGETIAVQMLIGNSPLFPTSLFVPTSTLTSQIITDMASTPFGSVANDALFFMALTLLVISLSVVVVRRKLTVMLISGNKQFEIDV